MTSGRVTSHVELRRGAYADSVTLLQVSRTVQGVAGVAAAQVAMATAAQRRGAHRDGLRGAAEADAQRHGRGHPARRRRRPRRRPGRGRRRARRDAAGATTAGRPRRRRRGRPARALRRTPGRDRAGLGARPVGLRRGDGRPRGRPRRAWSSATTCRSSRSSRSSGTPPSATLLVMGPDCGTAVVGGLGLGFANVVAARPGRDRRRVRHRLPAGARAARPRRRRRRPALGVGGRDLSRRGRAAWRRARRCAGWTPTRRSS